MKPLPRLALAAVTLWCAANPAWSQPEPDLRANSYTKGDFALLPEWCIDSQDGPYGSPEGGEYINKSPRARERVAQMGQDFWHMHHYCRGLRNMMRLRSLVLAPQIRKGLMDSTVGEFAYVINNCKPTMPLMPEVYLKLGELHLMRQDLPSAQQAFEKSRQIKPDYWPAYDRWVAALIELKQWSTARELAREGLQHAPGQANLKARLATIDAATGSRATR